VSCCVSSKHLYEWRDVWCGVVCVSACVQRTFLFYKSIKAFSRVKNLRTWTHVDYFRKEYNLLSQSTARNQFYICLPNKEATKLVYDYIHHACLCTSQEIAWVCKGSIIVRLLIYLLMGNHKVLQFCCLDSELSAEN
jgi:hypothetical protein